MEKNNMWKWSHLSSWCRSAPREGGAETVARIVGPKTATSFNNISNDTLACLYNENRVKMRRVTSRVFKSHHQFSKPIY